MSRQNYILITPAKNEEESITKCIESIINQTVTPTLWVLVDDGSTDRTPEIIGEAEEKYPYIKRIRLAKGKMDLGLHYAHVCKRGFDYAIEFCKKKGIYWNYISLLNADIIVEKDYFENLIEEFEKDPDLGIASGGTWSFHGREYIQEKVRRDIPSGAARLWKRRCFEETSGYVITYAPDTVSMVKAKLRGWKTKRFERFKSYQTRPTSSAEGLWKGYKFRGEETYYLCYHPIHILLRGLKYLLQPKFYLSFAYLSGYLGCFIHKKPRIEDEEIKNYFREQMLKELIDIYLVKNKKV